MKILNECLSDKTSNNILPFLWLHGESKEELAAEIDAIKQSGADAFCAESRVYENFCEEKWFDDFGFILEEAKKRNMQVWLLDDKHFPTGYANGIIEKHPEFKKKYLKLEYIDVAGPKNDIALLINSFVKPDEKLICAVMYQRADHYKKIDGTGILLPSPSGDFIYTDIPKGVFRVYFCIETKETKHGFENYIDMLTPESAQLQIEAVYAPQYEHFSEYFGNTFSGFFSDEPSFASDSGVYDSKLGKDGMYIPWRSDMPDILAQEMNIDISEVLKKLPFLWADHISDKFSIRYNYMNTVSKLFKENFSMSLGNWCRDHGVMYIGHTIEDMNTHMRLGYGAGHFFRGLDGQDMAGCDIVLNQMIPGIKEHHHRAEVFNDTADPTFYSYTLAKLAASHSHIQPEKKGRALCEVFGAFGWVEGIPMMKQIADHMLVSGINHFVPHAFSIKYPDPDCPPHFYIGGKNPQFEYFGKLTRYMRRVSHLLCGGVHQASVAVFYNAEAEWCGGDYTLFQEVSKHLLQNQIDFDFVPADHLLSAKIKDKKLIVNNEEYSSLVVSYSEVLPESLLKLFRTLSDKGLEIIFCDAFPTRTCEITATQKYTDSFVCVETEKLSEYLKNNNKYDILIKDKLPYLRFYHTIKDERHIYMFTNEDIVNPVNAHISMRSHGKYIEYDPWENTVKKLYAEKDDMNLVLNPSESKIIIFEDYDGDVEEVFDSTEEKIIIDAIWNVYKRENGDFSFVEKTTSLKSYASRLSGFCGVLRYETEITTDRTPIGLEIENLGDFAVIYVNGIRCGDVLYPPYRVSLIDSLTSGKNKITIDVYTNLAYREKDAFSRFLPLPPMGISGSVKFIF